MARRRVSLLTGSALLLGALTASAQSSTAESRPERPYRGVFAGGLPDAAGSLTVNGSAGTGYDTSASTAAAEAGLPGLPPAANSKGSIYNQFSGSLSYSARLNKMLSAGAGLSSTARQYPQVDNRITTSHGASSGLSMNTNLSKRTTVNGGVSASYQTTRGFTPFVQLSEPILGQVAPPGPDFASQYGDYYTYGAQAGISRQLSRRSSLAAAYNWQTSQQRSGIDDLSNRGGSIRFSRSLTRDLGLHVG